MEMVQPYLLGAPISDAPLVTSVGRNGALQSTWCGFYFDTFQPAPTRLRANPTKRYSKETYCNYKQKNNAHLLLARNKTPRIYS